MNILAVDTSSEFLVAAVSTSGQYFESFFRLGLKHAEHLLFEIDHLLGKADISPSDLDLIVCTRGPGSFTGLRIGMATAKGLARGAGIPMVSVPTLEVHASTVERRTDRIIIPAIDAKKRRYYTAFITDTETPVQGYDLGAEEILERLRPSCEAVITGPDGAKLHDEIHTRFATELQSRSVTLLLDPALRRSWGSSLVEVGSRHFALFGPDDERQGPIYLRKSEAELGRQSS
jgi:tRNA threonylcarbamoyladenosine biosynthesis protein TsaB